MPPKSAKKEKQSSWHVCDKCGVKVNQIKLKSHEENCGELLLGVINEKFNTLSITPSLPPEISTKDAPTTYLQRFLFIPESVCIFCNFTMNSNLLIQVNGQKYVRSSWTISDKHMDEVFSTSEGKTMILSKTKFAQDLLHCRTLDRSRREYADHHFKIQRPCSQFTKD